MPSSFRQSTSGIFLHARHRRRGFAGSRRWNPQRHGQTKEDQPEEKKQRELEPPCETFPLSPEPFCAETHAQKHEEEWHIPQFFLLDKRSRSIHVLGII